MWDKVFGFLSSPVTQWLKNRGEVKAAEHKRDLAVIDNQARLAASEQEYNHQWEMESLKGNPKWLRIFCFFQIAIPLNISVFNPEAGAAIWANLDLVPPWYVQLYMIVIGSIWGIHEFKNAAPSVIQAVINRGKNAKEDIYTATKSTKTKD